MSLELVAGPPNSGRAGVIVDRFGAALDRDPLLVVPTADDVARFERELCNRPGGALGGDVTSFPGLFDEVARACGAAAKPPLTGMQRVWLARAATVRCELRLLRRSSLRSGFAPALEALLSDLGAAGMDAAALGAAIDAAEEADDAAEVRYEREIASLFSAYEQLRDQLGAADQHLAARAATAALRAQPERWRERPVLLYGFDDLVREQIELVAALADVAEVTVAITYEDRPALAARAELLGTLVEELGGTVAAELAADPSYTDEPTLFQLERNLFERAPTTAPCEGGLRLIEAAGDRGQAEMIGRRIARSIAAGTDPDRIAVVVRSPDREAPLLARVLGSMGIPVAAEATVAVASTATGATLLRALAIASGEGSAADVVAFLRGPGRARPETVDWLERAVRRGRLRTAAEALEAFAGDDEKERRIWALDALAGAAADPIALAAAVARIATEIAERPHLRAGLVPSGDPALELRAAAEVSRTLEEVAALGGAADVAEITELLGYIRVPLWRGATEGRVRILSPYRLRASRVDELFVAGLTDGSFPSAAAVEPLLGDQRRRRLGIPSRREAAAEERYLFYTCVSRPERALHLCWPATDDGGGPTARSPFVDEVRALLDPPPTPDPQEDPLELAIAEVGSLADVAPEPEAACSPRELARALALLGSEEAERRGRGLRLPAAIVETALGSVAAAREAIAAAREPGPLTAEPVLASLADSQLFGASTLEEYDTCSYRWFVSHELDPQGIDPDPEPLETGGIIHAALERLYRNPPGPRGRPSPEDTGAWSARARELLREVAVERGWDLGAPRALISLARLDAVVERYLHRDAETGGPMMPDPDLLEAAFGRSPDDGFAAVDVGGFELHGRIDRIDVSANGKALIRDYKLSAKVLAGKKLVEEGKLQLPLYMLAVQTMGLEPIGGVYHPLGASREDRPRGPMVADHKGSLIPGETSAHYQTDFLSQEDFEAIVEGASERANGIVTAIRAGEISRNPRGGECPSWCSYAPICRMERSLVEPDPEAEEDER